MKGQDATTYLKDNAVRIDNPSNLNDSVYNLLYPYQVIMIGEMHGSNEPAELVSGLAKLFSA